MARICGELNIIARYYKEAGKTLFVGIAGTPGSGKSTFCKNLKEQLEYIHELKPLIIPMDGYHYYRHELDNFPDPTMAHFYRGAEFTFNS